MTTPDPRAWLALVSMVGSLAAAQPAAPASAADAGTAGLEAVAALAQINGQALACQEPVTARRVKNLMLVHAPKTLRYGMLFDEHTQQAFLTQTRNSAVCPDGAAFSARLDAVALRLQASLPAAGAGR